VRKVTGSLWDFLGKGVLVIPSTIGWTRAGDALMGNPLFREAAVRYPALSRDYGELCKSGGRTTSVRYLEYDGQGLLIAPTKPLDVKFPAKSWKGAMSIGLLARTLRRIYTHESVSGDPPRPYVFLPLLGQGEGSLEDRDLEELMEDILHGDRFVLVVPETTKTKGKGKSK
jgi:hypothetical protein